MKVVALEIEDIKVLTPKTFEDPRGFFSETYNKVSFGAAGIDVEFVQDNHSLSTQKGTVRGLHFQAPPYAQHKLVRVVHGSILGVAVDIRRGSPTYGRHVSIAISAESWNQFFVPIGFAHGLCTLEPHTEVLYKVSNYYRPDHDFGLLWNDREIGIEWPVSVGQALVSEKDRKLPKLKDLDSPFVYRGPLCGEVKEKGRH